MNWLVSELEELAGDKARHFVAGAIVAALVASSALALGGIFLAPLCSFSAAWLAGLWKEARDKEANYLASLRRDLLPHVVEEGDVLATVSGSCPVVLPLCVYIVTQALRGHVL